MDRSKVLPHESKEILVTLTDSTSILRAVTNLQALAITPYSPHVIKSGVTSFPLLSSVLSPISSIGVCKNGGEGMEFLRK